MNHEPIYGVIGALAKEVEVLLSKMEGVQTQTVAGVEVHRGTLQGKPLALCRCGMGNANAAAATQLLITGFGVGAVINTGIAGNLSPILHVGEVAIATSVLYHDGEPAMLAKSFPFQSEFEADETLVSAAARACRALSVPCATGRIATGDAFISAEADRKRIQRMYAPLCVEMESAAVGHIAAKNGVPFVCVRAMSDDADEAGREKLVVQQFDISAYCQTAGAIVEDMLRLL